MDTGNNVDVVAAAGIVGALAGRATAADFVEMANRLADAKRGTREEAVYRALADRMPYMNDSQLWYETAEGFCLAKQLCGVDDEAGPLH